MMESIRKLFVLTLSGILLPGIINAADRDLTGDQQNIVFNSLSNSSSARSSDVMPGFSTKSGPLSKVGSLAGLQESYVPLDSAITRSSTKEIDPIFKIDRRDRVLIEVVAKDRIKQLLKELEKLGFEKTAMTGRIISGWIPIEEIEVLAEIPDLEFARPSVMRTWRGFVDSQGDLAMAADVARSNFDVDGSGITVGVLSDSYDCRDEAEADVASEDLPEYVRVIRDEKGCDSGSDEGRAMMQLIHDVAPGARLSFHSAFNGEADFAGGIRDLANEGARVIVDDVIYFSEPMFQDGEIAQAVDEVHSQGVAYFSSAGNNGRNAYESPFRSSGIVAADREWHDFNPGAGVDIFQRITVPVGAGVLFSFQWDEPFYSVSGKPGSGSDLDICITSNPSSGNVTFLACGLTNNTGKDPLEIFSFVNTGEYFFDGISGADTTFNIVIGRESGAPPGRMKYVRFHLGSGISIDQYDTQSGTIFGHAGAQGARAVGAAYYQETPVFGQNPPLLESFSSSGPVSILFDTAGDPVIETRDKPEIVAPDGTDNTFFGFDSDSSGFPNFFGTSAAAPHAAAVAALMLSENPTLSVNDIYSDLESSAIDMEASGYDHDSGHGLIDAVGAFGGLGSVDLDSFMMYKNKVSSKTPKFYKFGPVEATDKIGNSVPYDVIKPKRLGFPAGVNGESAVENVTIFNDYQIKLAKGGPKFQKRKDLIVSNQCTHSVIEITKADGMLVPSSLDYINPEPGLPASSLDHYLCYQAKIPSKDSMNNKVGKFPKNTQVEVEDELQTRRYDLKSVKRWCTPVATDGAPIFQSGGEKNQPVATFTPSTVSNPDFDLLCYSAKPATKSIEQSACGAVDVKAKGEKIDPKQLKHEKRQLLHVNNKFGPLTVDTNGEELFCMPSKTYVQ